MKKSFSVLLILLTAVVITAAVFGVMFYGNMNDNSVESDIPLKITSQPTAFTVESGYAAEFSVKAEGSGLTYSWETVAPNGTVDKIKGKLGDTLSIAADMTMNGKKIRCTVTDKNGASVTSEAALLTVQKEHTFGELMVTKENSCLTEGEGTFVCSSCGEKQTKLLPAQGHDFDENISYTGKRRFVCKRCAYSFETDARDKSALDAALAEIPEYVGVYYDSESAKALLGIMEKLETTVYGVKNYDLLSQKETDEYTQRIKKALPQLSLKRSECKSIFITTAENDKVYFSVTDSKNELCRDKEGVLTDVSLYVTTKKPSFLLTVTDGKRLFSANGNRLLLQSCAEDPTMMRTALVYNTAERLGISEAPVYDIAEVYSDGVYLGAYVVRDEPFVILERSAELKSELTELLNSDKSYDEIKKRIDTARFARYIIMYCLLGLSDSVNTESLLFEDNGKISVHLPFMCDSILAEKTAPDFNNVVRSNDITAALTKNSDFNTYIRYVYETNLEKLMNVCTFSDTRLENDGNLPESEDTDISSFGKLIKKYRPVFERNFSDGAVTYTDSFGTIMKYPSFSENAEALAKALYNRLSAWN